LPRGQLKVLAESQLEQELPPLLEIDESSMRHSGRVCPEDGFELVEYEFGGSGIKLDQCLSCRGVWLDQGELKKLMAYVYEHSDEMAEPADQEAEEGDHLSLRVRALSFLYQLTARPPYI
jgi:Zn-finger nucleic acid-binding protein